MSPCPTPETLARLGSDSLPLERAAAVEQHVEACSQCEARLEQEIRFDPGVPGPQDLELSALNGLPALQGFVLERGLGHGGMGVVVLAQQEMPPRTVAIKFVPSKPAAGSRDRQQWFREVRATARLRHPNVVQLFEAKEIEGWRYLVMEYVAGGTLRESLAGPIPARIAATLVGTIARAVQALHDIGIVHLDLKPSNILLDGEQAAGWERITPKVADFGIARLRNESGATTASRDGPLGTPDYMAPEQATADRGSLGPACDIYALGAILYQVLAGRPPFQAASVVETLDQVRGQEPVPPRQLNPRIPRDLDTICLKCLQKDPSRRYESADALADDLKRWQEGRPIAARPASTFERAWRWCRRRPAIAALAAALMLTLVASFMGLVVVLKHAQAQRDRAIAARRLAEENETAAVATIRQLALLASTVISGPDPMVDSRALASAQILRDQIKDLKKHPGFDRSLLGCLGDLERRVALKFTTEGRAKKGRALLTEAIALLEEGRETAPTDPTLLLAYISSLGDLACLDFEENQVDRGLRSLEKAASLVPTLGHEHGRVNAYTRLWTIHQNLAGKLAVRGDEHRRRLLLEASLRLFGSLDSPGLRDANLVVCKARALADLGATDRAEESLRTALEHGAAEPGGRRELGQALAGLTADRFLRRGPAVSPSNPTDDATHGAWADALLAEVHARCARFDIEPAVTSEAALSIARTAYLMSIQQRLSGKLTEARRTGERIRALADRLVKLYPDRPSSHMVLSEALVLQAKTAWKVDDNETARRLEVQALDAARHAADLDPRNDDARRLVVDRERRAARP